MPPSPIATADFANWTYELDCGLGQQAFDLVDGQYNSDEGAGELVRLFDVWRDDYDGDGQPEALVNLGCAAGANLVTEFVFAYDAEPGGSVLRRGGALEVFDGFILRETADRFNTYEARPGPDEPSCCPSHFAHQTWTVNFTDTEVFAPIGPEELIPAEQLPQDPSPPNF